MFSAILIAGPTASGKSALGIELARRFDGTVINADSMQVYGDLRILSARPDENEEKQAPHALFGTVDGVVNYSVGLWLADATRVLDDVRAAGKLPIFVGGTGMYFKALTQGLSDIPAVSEEVRTQVRAQAAGVAVDELHKRLALVDPVMAAKLRPSDPQRILRALEIFAATGQSLSVFQGARSQPVLKASECLNVFVAPERAALFERIDARFDVMLETGALDEVEKLAARGLDPALPVMRAHGVPHLARYLAGDLSLDEARDLSQRDTRHYAKRQFTFARHQLPDFQWMPVSEVMGHAARISL